jgi:hypothetical protein
MRRLLLALALLALPASSLAAVAQVNSYSNSAGAASVTVASVVIASNEVAIVSSSWRLSAGQTITSVTFNSSTTGVSQITGTLLDTDDGEGRQESYIINGVTGTADVVVTLSAGTATLATQVRVFSGVDTGGPTGTIATATGGGVTVTVDASSAAGNLVMDNVVYRAGAALTIGASQTNEIEITGGSVSLHGSIETGAGTVTMSWTDADGSSEWAIVAIPLVAGGGGGGGTGHTRLPLLGVGN